MPTTCANLDALIIREDLFAKEEKVQPTPAPQTIKTGDLDPNSLWFKSLRKPDFQRETASWEPEKIKDFIESFVKGHFIPGLIFWRSDDGKLFVIDGAHRLSAMIAWVTDDYGDKDASIKFFKNEIPSQQKKIADRTRKLINDSVGAYSEMGKILDNPHSSEQKKLYARNTGTLPLSIQWVSGTAEVAEESFKKINQSSTPIDATEFQMIVSRKKANAIATRALMRKGVGHEYWKAMTTVAPKIVQIAQNIHDMLFTPPIERPIKTLDLPVAGESYSPETMRLIFEFVNLANGLVVSQSKLKEISEDADGSETVKYLERVSGIISIICSKSNCSLGLHPAVYFYSHSGRYQPTAFLATVNLVMWLQDESKPEKDKDYHWFTEHRKNFEDFLLDHRYFVNDIVSQFGSGLKGYSWVLKLYKEILFQISEGKTSGIAQSLINADKWRLKERQTKEGLPFSMETKTFIVLRECLASAVVCKICGARIHRNSLQIDHIQRKSDGGSGWSDNGQLSHPFCNTTFKEKKVKESKQSAGA